MSLFFRMAQHLLPRSKAWSVTVDKALTKLFKGVAEGVPPAVRKFIDRVYEDIWPDSTREIREWERQFALPPASLTDQERRDRYAGAWKAVGGQSPRYIQDRLQQAGFDLYIHEWWQQPYTQGDPRAVRDPNTVVLADGSPPRYFLCSGGDQAVSGGEKAISGHTDSAVGYLLVNKPQGGPYAIPTDENQWRYILYVGGPTFGDLATISPARRDELETLLLQIRPAQQWWGVLVEYA